MPYRIKAGQTILLMETTKPGRTITRTTTMKRTTDFQKRELIASPLDEHHQQGIGTSPYPEMPWGFNVVGKWKDVGNVIRVYASEVLNIGQHTPTDAKVVTVQGSGTNVYTLTLNDHGAAVHCTCAGFRFKRVSCKHIIAYNETHS